ncbi:hypothetical protein [Paracidovorax wautersii]|uniref:Uncharacterized protein n=1 Tax=Paracidovorax wautersii TaxID=1177982 RepID=A0ABU1IG78_9BURK|nr:hypothetical protein [Paracidovorax wautersii]MDR6216229.1 hypothetical protein [Paracidovorax wautersii]
MATEITEFAPSAETVTAHIDTSMETGERYSGVLIVGHYPAPKGDPVELWIERGGQRVGFQAGDLAALIKQLKRSERIAKEMAHG